MRLLIAFLLLGLTACQTATSGTTAAPFERVHPPPPDVDMTGKTEALIEFVRLAFFTDGENDIGASMPLVRRVGPVTASIVDAPGGAEAVIEAALQEYQALTGLPYRIVRHDGRQDEGDLNVVFVSRETIQEFIKGANCVARKWYKDGLPSLVNSSEAFVQKQIGRKLLERCAVEELAHGFGLRGDGFFGLDTAFGVQKHGYSFWLTDADRASMWIAYHPDLAPGMFWIEAGYLVRQIVEETWGGRT